MRVEVARRSVGLFSARRVLEDDEVVGLALLEDRIDAELAALQREDERARRNLVADHAEDVRDRDFLRRVVWLEARFHACIRIDRKIIESLEVRARIRFRIADADSEARTLRDLFAADGDE